MVIWRNGETAWSGFGSFGESNHGKTPLSFAFARTLFLIDKPQIKIFDDCFTIEDGRIRQCRIWGNRERLGEAFYTELAEAMRGSGRSVTEVKPGRDGYPLGKVAVYLLLFADNVTTFEKQRCSRQEFVENLMSTNPFTWNYPKPGKEIVLQRFRESWSYFIIHRKRETTKEFFDLLANEAIADSKSDQ
jgi:hypothetical protein